ncbi:MAG: BMC domain-containing protein [Candidatus Synoicihabitans palmerolidicus]|nr:BMC domain-containing protein [Candidatus Synoicihabitans palmerolidicus]
MAQEALGIIETKGLCTLVETAADALRAANVTLTGFGKIGSGNVAAFFRGDVAALKAAVDAGADSAQRVGEVVAVQVIPRPHEDIVVLGPWIE